MSYPSDSLLGKGNVCKTCGGSGELDYDDGVTTARRFPCSHCAGTGTSRGHSRLARIAGVGPARENVGRTMSDEEYEERTGRE